MGVQYVYAKEGYEFQPTEAGKKEGKVLAKYNGQFPSTQYKVCVPKRWVTDGWVEEVESSRK